MTWVSCDQAGLWWNNNLKGSHCYLFDQGSNCVLFSLCAQELQRIEQEWRIKLGWTELETDYLHSFIHWLVGSRLRPLKQPLPSTPSALCPAAYLPFALTPHYHVPLKTVSTEAQEAKGVLQEEEKGWRGVSTSLLPLLRSKPVCSLEGRLAPFISCPTCLEGTTVCPFPFLLELEGSSRVGSWAISSASQIPPPQHLFCVPWSCFLSTSTISKKSQVTMREVSSSAGPRLTQWLKQVRRPEGLVWKKEQALLSTPHPWALRPTFLRV